MSLVARGKWAIRWRLHAASSRQGHYADGRRGQSGFSLIEVIVTVLLIVIVTLSMGRLFIQTQSTAADNSGRQDAAAVATSVISNIADAPYSIAGLTAAHTDQAKAKLSSYYSSAYSGALGSSSCSSACGSYYYGGTAPDQQLVTIAAGQTDLYHYFTVGTNAKAFAGYLTKVTSGTWSFTVTTRVTWVTSQVPGCPGNGSTAVAEAEEEVSVLVTTKSSTAGTISVSENSIVYPGGLSSYAGSSYSSAGIPSTPVITAVTPSATTGQVNVSWTVPASGYGACYEVSWVDTNQNVYTTGMVSNSYLLATSGTGSGYITAPPSAGSSGTAVFGVGNLAQADPFTFFVVAYSVNGVESAESVDSASAISPAGPVITGLSPAFGPNGSATSVTVTGTGLATTETFGFGAAGNGTVVSCSGTTSCIVTSPSNGTGLVNVIATDTGGIGSPPTVENSFSFAPAITAISESPACPLVASLTVCPDAGGTVVTITGTNLVGVTHVFFGATAAKTFSCSSSTTCTATSPAGGPAVVVDVTATSPGGTSFTSNADKFPYQ